MERVSMASAVASKDVASTDDEPWAGVCDVDRWRSALPALSAQYRSNQPFAHIVLDDFLLPEVFERAVAEFPGVAAEEWTNYVHVNERKRANKKPDTWGPTLQQVSAALCSPAFERWLTELTGIDALEADDTLDGGGLHQCLRGGFLNVHADFTAHHHVPHWRRRVNLLLYLNPVWHQEWNGSLGLWTSDVRECVSEVLPIGNRVVLFSTDVDSFHGHPDPLECPADVARQSLALYYFTHEAAPVTHSTDYRARPSDGAARRLPIFLDKTALRAYDTVKRRFQLDDAFVSRVMRRFGR
jgi:hypothetical protein